MGDIFNDKNCIHVAVSRDTHVKLRIELYKKRLSVTDAVAEFVRLVANGDKRAHKILDELVTRKLREKIENLRALPPTVDESDKDALYDLIDSASNNEDKK